MDIHDQFKSSHDELNKINQQKQEEFDRANFITNMRKHLMTVAVGSIDEIEVFFGHLWGNNKPYRELSDVQKQWREIWKDMREELFNSVNKRIRIMENEINNFTIYNHNYFVEFKVRSKDNG